MPRARYHSQVDQELAQVVSGDGLDIPGPVIGGSVLQEPFQLVRVALNGSIGFAFYLAGHQEAIDCLPCSHNSHSNYAPRHWISPYPRFLSCAMVYENQEKVNSLCSDNKAEMWSTPGLVVVPMGVN
jgi:hypothetical protein